MEQNPLELEKNNKISVLREEVKHETEELFSMSKERQKNRIDDLISKLEIYQENGLVFDKGKILKEVIESMSIENKETFVSSLMKALEPIIIAKITQVDVFRKIENKNAKENRARILSEDGNIKLSEVLYAGLSDKSAHIHLADAYDYMTKEKIVDFNLEIINGLKNLAKLIKIHKNIEKITATSWIVAVRGSAERLKKMGFTILGPISEEERKTDFEHEKVPIAKAFMTRKDFLDKYDDDRVIVIKK